FSLLFQPLANQCVLIGVQFDVVGDRLVNEIAARTVLRGGQRIKSVDLFSDRTETDGFLIASHNARTITHIFLYYNSVHPGLAAERVSRGFPSLQFWLVCGVGGLVTVRGGERLGHFSGPFRATPFPLVDDRRLVLALKGSFCRVSPLRPRPLRAVLRDLRLPTVRVGV